MRVNPSELSSGFLLALSAALLFLAPGSSTYAQSASRSFQMGLWTDPSRDANTDIATFWAPDQKAPPPGNQPQPPAPRRTILLCHEYYRSLYDESYDWSRMVALEIDEPYNSLAHDPCEDGGSAAQAQAINTALAQRAAELKALNPRARLWVNFTIDTVGWMRDGNCQSQGLTFNNSYIDVVSIDYYDHPFSPDVQSYYGTLLAQSPKPDQQLALIPGVYSAANDQFQYLQGYFDYANNTNQTCNLPLGSRGVTGVFDGCPVWIVLGWLSNNIPGYVGMLDPNPASQEIAAAWQAELRLPLRPGITHPPTPAEQTLLVIKSQLLHN